MNKINFKVAIIEDCKDDSNHLINLLNIYQEDNKDIFYQVDNFTDASIFLDKFNFQYDLLFIDIDLNNSINGLDFAKKIREKDENVLIIFVTNISKFATFGYEVDALNYIVKPIRYQALVACMQKVIKIIKNRPTKSLIINTTKGIKKISIDQIMYIEVEGHDIKVHLASEIIQFVGSLKNVEKNIDSPNFVRCNYCYLVNLKYIHGIDKNDVLINNEKLRISAPRKKKFVEQFMDYLMKNNLMNN